MSFISYAILKHKSKKINTIEKYFEFLYSQKLSENKHLQEFTSFTKSVPNESLDSAFTMKKYDADNLLKEKYNVSEIAKDGDTFSKSIRVMQWLTDNTLYNGMQLRLNPDDTDKILTFALAGDFAHSINCRLKAIALADLLISIGITALPLVLIGMEDGCHLMVHVYLEESDTWVVLDPSFNAYFTCDGKILNIVELRDSICAKATIEINGYNFNGSTTECIDIYRNQFIYGCLEYILAWKDNKRKISKYQKVFGCEFNYILEPDDHSYFSALEKKYDAKRAKQYAKNQIRIGAKELLQKGKV